MTQDDHGSESRRTDDKGTYLVFESLDSISSRFPVRREMHLNIYDQTDVHRGYIGDGVCDGPSPELVERSLHRMAERGIVPSVDTDGNVVQRAIYVAAVPDPFDMGAESVTWDTGYGSITLYTDDGLDLILGSHDVFELISDLKDLFIRIVVRSLYDSGFADPSNHHLLILERGYTEDSESSLEVRVPLDPQSESRCCRDESRIAECRVGCIASDEKGV